VPNFLEFLERSFGLLVIQSQPLAPGAGRDYDWTVRSIESPGLRAGLSFSWNTFYRLLSRNECRYTG
jgi:hypothetical protein